MILAEAEKNSSTDIIDRYYLLGKRVMIKNYIEEANFENTI